MEENNKLRIASSTGGFISAVVSVFLIFYLDIFIKLQVSWLLLIAITGLIGGVLLLIGSTSIDDDEDKRSRILVLLGTILLIGFDIVLILMQFDAAIVEYAPYHAEYGIIYYTGLVLAQLGLGCSIYATTNS